MHGATVKKKWPGDCCANQYVSWPTVVERGDEINFSGNFGGFMTRT